MFFVTLTQFFFYYNFAPVSTSIIHQHSSISTISSNECRNIINIIRISMSCVQSLRGLTRINYKESATYRLHSGRATSTLKMALKWVAFICFGYAIRFLPSIFVNTNKQWLSPLFRNVRFRRLPPWYAYLYLPLDTYQMIVLWNSNCKTLIIFLQPLTVSSPKLINNVVDLLLKNTFDTLFRRRLPSFKLDTNF